MNSKLILLVQWQTVSIFRIRRTCESILNSNLIYLVFKEIDQELTLMTKKFNFSEEVSIVLGIVIEGKLTLSNLGKSTTLLVKDSNIFELSSRSDNRELEGFMGLVDPGS